MAVVYVLNLDVAQVRALLRAAGVAPHAVLEHWHSPCRLALCAQRRCGAEHIQCSRLCF